MQALKLAAGSGWQWIAAGWRTFRKQPFGFTALLFFYWLLLLVASAAVSWVARGLGAAITIVSADAIAMICGLCVAALTPALTVGFLQACRAASQGLPVHPILLFAPFRAGRATLGRLIALGAIQMAALVLILLATTGGDAFRAEPAEPTPPTTSAPATPTLPTADAPMTEADERAMTQQAIGHVEQGLAYLPVAMLMWYAPMLVAWHRLPVGKALFFSIVAVWRNRGAFAVYGVAWLAIWIALSFVVTLIAVVLHLVNFAAIAMAPLVMVLLTWMYCSVYATYDAVFVSLDEPTTS